MTRPTLHNFAPRLPLSRDRVPRRGHRLPAPRRTRHPHRRSRRRLRAPSFLSRLRHRRLVDAHWRHRPLLHGPLQRMGLAGFLCRLSANPETCILRSAEYFYRRGKQTLLFAKFIPGINTMSPPLAGSMKMGLGDFLQFDTLGAIFYVGAYSSVGYLFSDLLRDITRGLRSAGFVAEIIFSVGLAAYVIYRIYIYRKYRLLDIVPRVHAEELARRLDGRRGSQHAHRRRPQPRLLRRRSERIAGSIRIEPNNLDRRDQNSPQGPRDLSLLHLSARSHQRPCGATTCRRIQGVRNRWRAARLAQSWKSGGTRAPGRPRQVAYVQLTNGGYRLCFSRLCFSRLCFSRLCFSCLCFSRLCFSCLCLS